MYKRFLHGPAFFEKEENRMMYEGNLASARENFLLHRFNNLNYLLEKRYRWMNDYISKGDTVVEIGCGAGLSPLYLNQRPILTDVIENDWNDLVIDATKMKLKDSSVDVVINSHGVHHFHSPVSFFSECFRVLKPGGVILIQEINTSLIMRFLLRVMKHEGWSYDVDVFNAAEPANDPRDPWSANCAIPELLFENEAIFLNHIHGFLIEKNTVCECLIFPLSGGVTSKIRMIPLHNIFLRMIDMLDTVLITIAPSVFAMGRSVALRKKG